jgi:DNA polymerase III gamma/tau subunit
MIGQGGASEKNQAQNALLKILEDTPKHVHIILCTTDPQRLIATIRNRCTTFTVAPLNDDEMSSLISHVLKQEGVDDFPPDAVEALLDAVEGCPRQALKILDQVIDLELDNIVESIRNSSQTLEGEVTDLFNALTGHNSWKSVAQILKGLKRQGLQPEKIRRSILGLAEYNAHKSFKKGSADIYMEIYDIFRTPTYDTGFPGITFACYEIIEG